MTLNESWFAPLVGLLILLAAAGAITAAVHFLLFRVVARLARLSATRIDDALFEFGAFRWLNRIVPFVVIKLGLAAVPGIPAVAAQAVDKVLFALTVFLLSMTISATLSALEHTHRTSHRDQPRLSLKGAMQLVKLVMFITAALVVIGDATGKQIGLLLSGIGAMSAVLMLIVEELDWLPLQQPYNCQAWQKIQPGTSPIEVWISHKSSQFDAFQPSNFQDQQTSTAVSYRLPATIQSNLSPPTEGY